MKATINGIAVEGTPKEIAEFNQLLNAIKWTPQPWPYTTTTTGTSPNKPLWMKAANQSTNTFLNLINNYESSGN